MVAYSFKVRFAEPILAGTKRQTIRAVGKRRHAKAGDALQLYTGMRTKHCRKIADKVCEAVYDVRLDWSPGGPVFSLNGRIVPAPHFAKLDGFASVEEMCEFWRENHPGEVIFEGVLIRW